MARKELHEPNVCKDKTKLGTVVNPKPQDLVQRIEKPSRVAAEHLCSRHLVKKKPWCAESLHWRTMQDCKNIGSLSCKM